VVEATKEYRQESDQFGAFLAECTDPAITGRIGIGVLAKCYSAWCEQNSESPRHRGTRQLKKVMAERGWHVETDRKDHPTIHGLCLKTEEAENVLQLK
jgi:phage/plasmid-associated DNA primase